MDPISKQYIVGEEFQLCSILQLGFNRIGYHFQNWKDSEGNIYLDAQLCTFFTDSTNISAQWNAINYSITYNLDGGTATSNPTTYNIETETITLLNDSTKQNYDFVKWVDTDGNQVTQIDKGSIGDVELSAIWKRQTIELTYDTGYDEN